MTFVSERVTENVESMKWSTGWVLSAHVRCEGREQSLPSCPGNWFFGIVPMPRAILALCHLRDIFCVHHQPLRRQGRSIRLCWWEGDISTGN